MSDKGKNIAFLGDGVYAEFEDEYQIVLRTGHHDDDLCEHKIYLDPHVLANLMAFYLRASGDVALNHLMDKKEDETNV
jgi:hypothetical protein